MSLARFGPGGIPLIPVLPAGEHFCRGGSLLERRTAGTRELCLIFRVGRQLYALPTEHVAETMRPQPVSPIPGGPSFVLGVATIRGLPVPVVDAASAFADNGSDSISQSARFVSIKAAGRHVALAVDEVVGVRQINSAELSDLPPLLASAKERLVSAMGVLDGALLLVLRSGKLLPDAAWAAIDTEIRS